MRQNGGRFNQSSTKRRPTPAPSEHLDQDEGDRAAFTRPACADSGAYGQREIRLGDGPGGAGWSADRQCRCFAGLRLLAGVKRASFGGRRSGVAPCALWAYRTRSGLFGRGLAARGCGAADTPCGDRGRHGLVFSRFDRRLGRDSPHPRRHSHRGRCVAPIGAGGCDAASLGCRDSGENRPAEPRARAARLRSAAGHGAWHGRLASRHIRAAFAPLRRADPCLAAHCALA